MTEPSEVFEDNKACIFISKGETDKKRTKHISKHYHFVRECIARGLVTMKYIATALQVADIFTKQLFPKHFARIRRVLLGEQSYEDMARDYEQHKLQGDNPDEPQTWNKAPSSQGPSGNY